MTHETFRELAEETWIHELSQEKFGGRVSEAQSFRRESESVRVKSTPASPGQLLYFLTPNFLEILPGGLAELLEGPTSDHSETKRRDFARASKWWQFFATFDGSLSFFELLAVKLSVGPVFGSDAADVTGSARPQAIE
jgi:hypothetical protein